MVVHVEHAMFTILREKQLKVSKVLDSKRMRKYIYE